MEERKILRTAIIRDKDLDGMGTEVVLRNARNILVVAVIESTVYRLEDEFKRMWFNGLLTHDKYDKILITDISLKESTVRLIDSINEQCPNFIEVYDHHATTVAKRDWMHINTSVSATKFVHQEFESMLEDTSRLDEFVELVNDWDTWNWVKTNNLEAVRLNDLQEYYRAHGEEEGLENFAIRMSVRVAYPLEDLITGHDVYYADDIKRERDSYIMDVEDYLKTGLDPFSYGRKFGYIYLAKPKYHSMLGHELCRRNPNLDYVAIITDTSVSFRTEKDINLLDFVSKRLNGGGHPKACGCKVIDFCGNYDVDMSRLKRRKIVYTVEGRDSFEGTILHTFMFTRKSIASKVLNDKQVADSYCAYCNTWTMKSAWTCDYEGDAVECFNEAEKRALKEAYGDYYFVDQY